MKNEVVKAEDRIKRKPAKRPNKSKLAAEYSVKHVGSEGQRHRKRWHHHPSLSDLGHIALLSFFIW